MLSAVAIGVGLSLITRGLSSQLRAVQALGDYDALLAVAHASLLQTEQERLATLPLGVALFGPAAAAPGGYGWQVEVHSREGASDLKDADGNPLMVDLAATVARTGARGPSVTYHLVWSRDWVPK